VSCHGGLQGSAPPVSAHGATATADVGVGAHQTHVNPGPFRRAVACEECHIVPATVESAGHIDKDRADVVFGGLATAGGAKPTWNGVSCSATYCHGGTLSGGSNPSPQWTKVDGTQAACGTCHGLPPPTASGHPPVTGSIPAACAACHPGTVRPDGTLDLPGGQHIDGVVQVGAAGCAGCHGDKNRTPAAIAAAPPKDTLGNSDTRVATVGAHQSHLVAPRNLSAPIACSECHPLPENLLHHPNYVMDIRWGPLATAGGAAPSWDVGTATCSATYCHGATLAGGTATTPLWTRVDGTQVTCTSCHGVPPPQPHPQAADYPQVAQCGTCHLGYTATTVNPALHINGYVELESQTCTSCHGDPNRPAALQAAPPADLAGNTSPSAPGVGAHQAHLTGTTLSSKPVACGECHPAVTSTSHAVGKGLIVDVNFGPLATAGGARPTWDVHTLSCASTYCHGGTLTGGTKTSPVWNVADGTQAACGTCHGVPPPDPHVQRNDCGSCHAGYTSTTVNLGIHLNGVSDVAGMGCTTCHGDATRAEAAIQPAPPVDTKGGSLPSARGVGAHLKHLSGGALSKAIACSECHPAPTVADHANGTVDMTWGPLAQANGTAPTWTGTTCTNYCHGATLTGGTKTAPLWTTVDGTQAACGTCHGNPPPSPHSQNTNCGGCHAGYGTATVNLATHVNGVVDVTASCTSCHGDATRPAAIASAPPVDTKGNTLTSVRGVGAHQLHLTSGSMRLAMAYTECHLVPADLTNHPSGTVDMTWGPLAQGGGVTATWNGSTCTNYCHGAALAGGTGTAPVWSPAGAINGTPACTVCHGMPPATLHKGGSHPASGSTASACNPCHPGTVKSDGTLDLAGGLHVNGSVEATGVSCTSCHGSATRTPGSIAAAPPAVHAACPSPCSTPTPNGGAHRAHLSPATSATGVIANPVACTECHTVPVDSAHANGSAPLVTWGPLSKTGGAAPSAWNGTTCSNTYCHGKFTGGNNSTPSWTGGALTCTSCHGNPPPSPHVQNTACGNCHAGYTSSTVNAATHVDGLVQTSPMACSSCHGDPARTLVAGADAQAKAAPPVDTKGNTAVTSRGVGAHLMHLNPPSTGIAGPIACNECHPVPTSMTHANGTVTVAFGKLSKAGLVTPTWNGTTCSNTYCHGNYAGGTNSTPVWATSGGLTCTTCHPSPPVDSCHPPQYKHPGGNSCSSCHKDTNAAGTAINAANAKLHVNGVVDGKCTDCHKGNTTVCK
jgi:predicted CxxxxCH...CXXCH cytochrome family protein